MRELKEKNINVTATVVYSPEQAYIDALANTDYVAVYYNKMYNVNMDAAKTVHEIADLYHVNHISTKIMAASFRNTRQVMEALLAGANAVTIPYSILKQFSDNPMVSKAVDDFSNDWEAAYGTKTITQLLQKN
jgi:fructose-6-phosphate aldolase 2